MSHWEKSTTVFPPVPNWDINRIGNVEPERVADGIYEIFFAKQSTSHIAINEAVDICKFSVRAINKINGIWINSLKITTPN